ncbi:MAG: Gfo/Idh/MocA family oxidoreductase, partial [Sedimentisphaerales bacterium]|nr:Gfo/Idh/MocA family oxidoreductase [Sedimentisphaerales bacterium]
DDVEIAYLCDTDKRRFARARAVVEEAQDRSPKLTQDFRQILDDKNVNVLINATPDHWHGLGTILACQAGKDVFVEKPMSHNLWEGRQMIEAARKYKRIVQVGTQSRSGTYMAQARDVVRSGKLGDVHIIRVFNMMEHPKQQLVPVQPQPDGLDYDMWCGPAAKLPYNPSRRWLNFFEYSCGPIPGDAVHQYDLARFLMGDPAYPKSVSGRSAIEALKDGRDCPDTQFALFEYDDFTLLFEGALWTPYMKKIPGSIRDSDQFPDWPFCSTKIEVCGTKGFLWIGRHGGGWQMVDSDGRIVQSVYGRQADKEHQDNFIDCIRSRKPANADVEQGHYSTLPFHLANIMGRMGNARLLFDAKTETITNLPEANRYLRRTYRTPWIVPEQV